MPTFEIYFDVRFYNGSIEIEADDAEKAAEKFHKIPISTLLEHTNNSDAEIESIGTVGDDT